ncbi:MAG: alpha/beta fold hydrolase, partial [Mycobacterium sp.]
MVTVSDGGRFRVTRIGAGHGVPVVLVPGMFDNRRLYLWPGGGGLADMLAGSGFDAWIVERRGTGGVALAAGARAGWEEMVRVDLPAVQRLVTAETGGSAFWVGHSFGGVALARAAAQTMQSQVAGLVLVNAAVDIPLLANPVVTAIVTARMWGDVFPARRLRLGPENEPVAALEDAISWGAAERACGVLSATLGAVDVPVLALTAPHDVIAPASRCDRLAQSFTSADRRVQSAARRHGFARNHTHESPLLNP